MWQEALSDSSHARGAGIVRTREKLAGLHSDDNTQSREFLTNLCGAAHSCQVTPAHIPFASLQRPAMLPNNQAVGASVLGSSAQQPPDTSVSELPLDVMGKVLRMCSTQPCSASWARHLPPDSFRSFLQAFPGVAESIFRGLATPRDLERENSNVKLSGQCISVLLHHRLRPADATSLASERFWR